jgi:hypothetical protein
LFLWADSPDRKDASVGIGPLERFPFTLAHGDRSDSLFARMIHRSGDSTFSDHALTLNCYGTLCLSTSESDGFATAAFISAGLWGSEI